MQTRHSICKVPGVVSWLVDRYCAYQVPTRQPECTSPKSGLGSELPWMQDHDLSFVTFNYIVIGRMLIPLRLPWGIFNSNRYHQLFAPAPEKLPGYLRAEYIYI